MEASRRIVHNDGTVEVTQLSDRETKKQAILKALMSTGIPPHEIPVLTVEVLAERVPMPFASGWRARPADALNPTASMLIGAAL